MLGLSEIAIFLIIIVLILGAKKLPELARSAGKSARILKAEARAMKAEKEREQQAGQGSPEQGAVPRVIEGEVHPSPGTAADGVRREPRRDGADPAGPRP